MIYTTYGPVQKPKEGKKAIYFKEERRWVAEMIKEIKATLFLYFYLSWTCGAHKVSKRWKKGLTWEFCTQSSYLKSLNYSIIVFHFPVLENNVSLDTLMELHMWIIRKNIWLLISCFYNPSEYHEQRVTYWNKY